MIDLVKLLFDKFEVDVDHNWGFELRIINEPEYCFKIMVIDTPSVCSSLHYHSKKKETFLCLEGELHLILHNTEHILVPGQSIVVDPKHNHRFWSDNRCIFAEVSTHHEDSDTYKILGSCVLRNIKIKYDIKQGELVNNGDIV